MGCRFSCQAIVGAGFNMRIMARVPFSKAEQDASFQLQMDITPSLSIFL